MFDLANVRKTLAENGTRKICRHTLRKKKTQNFLGRKKVDFTKPIMTQLKRQTEV